MKKILSAAIIAAVGLSMTSCDDFLDDNRYPETQIVNNPLFWSNPDNCDLEVNRLYQFFYGYGNGNTLGNFYFNTLTDDQCANSFVDWKFTNIPTSSSAWNDPYTIIRNCNQIIEGVTGSSLTDAQKNNFIGLARLMRGYYYYQLVRRYGDVPLVERVLDPVDQAELFGPRTSRKDVMDYAYNDMVFASENITLQSGKQKFTRDLALAMLSDLCLYEGTFWKYCTLEDNYYAPDAARSKTYLERCATHSDALISRYPIGDNYAALYNSQWTANAVEGITGLSNNSEVIFATEYEKDLFMHSTTAYTCSSTAIYGITKDAFDAYLFIDGLPASKTSYDTTDEGEAVESLADSPEGKGLSIKKLLDVRDARLSMTTDPYVYYQDMSYVRAGSSPMTSSTGYGVRKYDNVKMPVDYRVNTTKNYISAPLYWGAVICLNYAEAKAELGTLTDADIEKTLNKLYVRAKLPKQTVASLSAINDPANNMGVNSLIYEVRRCRRCELIMDNDFRYWDLIRWHKLDVLVYANNPDVYLGANVKNAPIPCRTTKGDYVNGSYGGIRTMDNRQYEWPLPQDQLNLNSALKQNENWTK